MPSGLWPRGSEWRKWDLQVHTPFSALNNGFGTDFEAYAKSFFELAVENEIAVVGVTDYFSIKGYRELRKLRDHPSELEALLGAETANKARMITLIPNIELRASVVVVSEGKASRVNFHVLFSDELDAIEIEDHFLRELKFTAGSNPGNPDESWSVTDANLEALGQRLKREQPSFQSKCDIFVGMMNACVSHEEVSKVLERQRSRFKDRFLLVVAADEDLSKCSWDGQAHLTRKLFIQKSHMLFSGNPSTRDFALGRKHSTPIDFKREFGGLKPVIHGSDAHNYGELFQPAADRYLWIKASPTFQGLRQLLYEPESRVHIGDRPPFFSRVDRNATKYISSISFERTEQARSSEAWFSGSVPLNHGLVAIIGNKGSGKSALADIIALAGDARCAEYFSFLTKDKFLNPKTKLGQMFQASARWHSGHEVARRLGAVVDETQPELVKCLPQNYLERICSELKESRDSAFERELMEVIFSHVSEEQRLGRETLHELIDHITKEKEARIAQLAEEVSTLNAAIASLEKERTEEHRKALQGQIAQKRAELEAHDLAKPQEVREPSHDPEQNAVAEAVAQLNQLVERVQAIDEEIARAHEGLRLAALQVAAADRLLTRIENLERRVETFHSESLEDSQLLRVDLHRIVDLSVTRDPIVEARARAIAISDAARIALGPDRASSLVTSRSLASAALDSVREQLDEPDRRYQEYLRQLAGWTTRRNEIEGAAANAGSLKGLEARLARLAEIPGRIAELKAQRATHVREIFRAKEELLADYRRLHSPVQEFIDRHAVSQQQQGALKFSAAIAVDGLVDGLLDLIHQGRRGSFQGEPEGRERLRELVARHDFSTELDVQGFLTDLLDHLEHDRRDGAGKPMLVQDQLRQGVSPERVYDFLYALGYLRPRFELRWRDKALDQLSPGERGNLLLVFYLLIDKRDVPLIIDQPEENLDNETIVKMLVPAIKYAKERRQIVLVTHNPNLAVVCDAEQIIHAHLDKTAGNRVTYTCGGIEDPVITRLIVDVLEGTKPAFDLRDAKYEVLERLA